MDALMKSRNIEGLLVARGLRLLGMDPLFTDLRHSLRGQILGFLLFRSSTPRFRRL